MIKFIVGLILGIAIGYKFKDQISTLIAKVIKKK